MAKHSANEIDEYIGRQVKARRRSLKMSQTELGVASGVTFQQIQKYENGTNRIGASALFHLAAVLQSDLAYFFPSLPETTQSDGTQFESETGAERQTDALFAKNFTLLRSERTRNMIGELIAVLVASERIDARRS